MKSGRSWSFGCRLFAGVAWLLIVTDFAHAQEEDIPVYGARERPPMVGFEKLSGDLSLSARASSDSDKPANGEKNSAKEQVYEEVLTLKTNGYVVHPNLAKLNLNGSFGLRQDMLDENGVQQRDNSTIYAWDTSAAFMQNSKAPLTLYSAHSRSLVDRSFGPTLENTQTLYGALWQLQSKYVPTELRVYHVTETQSALNSSESDFTLDRNAFEWHSEGRPTDRQQLDWNYHLESSQQDSESGISESSDAQSASLNHSINFGTNGSSLDSGVSWSHITGLYSADTKRWNELLRLRHTRTFETNYEYTADQQEYSNISQTRQRAAVGFRHKLYESLTTTGRTGWQHVSLSDDSSTTDWFDNLDFNYHKKVPFGLLINTLNLSYNREENGARSVSVPIRNQPLVFDTFSPVIIPQQNIVPSSIIIRNAAGQIFAPGDGYTVTPIAQGVQLTPVPAGPFSLNEPLFLFYDIGAAPANVVTTRGLSLSARYEIQRGWLKGLSPYGRYGMTDQDVEGGQGTVLANSTHSYTYGVDYRIWDLRLKAEHETFDSDLYPYETTRFEARLDHRMSSDTTVSISGTFTSTDYPAQDDHIDTTLVTAGGSRQLSRELFINASASWINIEDDVTGRTQGLEEQLQIIWQHRQTQVFGRLRNSTLETDQTERSFQFLEIGIRRDF